MVKSKSNIVVRRLVQTLWNPTNAGQSKDCKFVQKELGKSDLATRIPYARPVIGRSWWTRTVVAVLVEKRLESLNCSRRHCHRKKSFHAETLMTRLFPMDHCAPSPTAVDIKNLDDYRSMSAVARDIEGAHCLIHFYFVFFVIAFELCIEGVQYRYIVHPFATDHVVHLPGACHGACRLFCHHVVVGI
jgi:hypothetical protein